MTKQERDELRAELQNWPPASRKTRDQIDTLLDEADARETAAVFMQRGAVYAAVSGGVLEPVDMCAADVRADPTEAETLAREAWQATGKSYRVMKVTEYAVYVGTKD